MISEVVGLADDGAVATVNCQLPLSFSTAWSLAGLYKALAFILQKALQKNMRQFRALAFDHCHITEASYRTLMHSNKVLP